MVWALVDEAAADEPGLLGIFSLGVFDEFTEDLNFILSQVLERLVRTQVLGEGDALPVASGSQRVASVFVISHHSQLLCMS